MLEMTDFTGSFLFSTYYWQNKYLQGLPYMSIYLNKNMSVRRRWCSMFSLNNIICTLKSLLKYMLGIFWSILVYLPTNEKTNTTKKIHLQYSYWTSYGNEYVLFVVITMISFPHSWNITWFVTRVTRWMPLVEQELLIIPEHLS